VAHTQAVQIKITQILELTARTQDNETEINYQQMQATVSELQAIAREAYQVQLKGKCKSILTKLEADVPLSVEEQETVRLLLVGDADYFLESEDQLAQWRDDVVRLVGEIEQLQASDLNEVDNLMRLEALCREAMRVLPDLAFYFRQKERVSNFQKTSSGPMSSATKQIVADLIRSMIDSNRL
jgi:hypothetical protein